jgi:hypothetical protein
VPVATEDNGPEYAGQGPALVLNKDRAIFSVLGTGQKWVRIQAYDLLGRRVALLVDGHFGRGVHSVALHPQPLSGRRVAPAGARVCELTIDGKRAASGIVHYGHGRLTD